MMMDESAVAVPRSMPSGWNSAAVYPALTSSSDTCNRLMMYQHHGLNRTGAEQEDSLSEAMYML